jgi:signal transduction histidine kinase
LVNLMVNAVQAMPEGGQLTIATQTDDGHILLVVEDTGSGMSPEVLPRIFTPFFTTKDIPEGNGLGLPVMHGIVSAHFGTCWPVSGETRRAPPKSWESTARRSGKSCGAWQTKAGIDTARDSRGEFLPTGTTFPSPQRSLPRRAPENGVACSEIHFSRADDLATGKRLAREE